MRASDVAGLEGHPPSVAEWEDLLVKLEIMPRVLRNTLEEVPRDDAGAAGVLDELVRREREVMEWLQAVAEGRPARAEAAARDGADARDPALVFASLRARSFAMVQRRGLEVWEWTGALDDGGHATVYQALAWLAHQDVRALAALRERVGAPSC